MFKEYSLNGRPYYDTFAVVKDYDCSIKIKLCTPFN